MNQRPPLLLSQKPPLTGRFPCLGWAAPNFGLEGLDINIRTKIRYDYSFIESAVVAIGEDTFEVSSFGDYFINHIGGAELPATISGYNITHTKPSDKKKAKALKLAKAYATIIRNQQDEDDSD